jgi:hypothetical protein
MRLLTVGTAALLLELPDLASTLSAFTAVTSAALPGIVHVLPAAQTLLLTYEPAITNETELKAALSDIPMDATVPPKGKTVVIPVVYDGDDLQEVAAIMGISRRFTDTTPCGASMDCSIQRIRTRILLSCRRRPTIRCSEEKHSPCQCAFRSRRSRRNLQRYLSQSEFRWVATYRYHRSTSVGRETRPTSLAATRRHRTLRTFARAPRVDRVARTPADFRLADTWP